MSLSSEERRSRDERLATIRQAQDLAPEDATLACLAETARGREYDASGDHERALTFYQNAMDLVNARHEDAADGITARKLPKNTPAAWRGPSSSGPSASSFARAR